MSLAWCTGRAKNGREKEPNHLLQVSKRKPFTKSDLMKNILPDSAVLAAGRCIGFLAVMALAAISMNRVSEGVTVRAAPAA
jgi:hypothetical protein